MATSNGCAPAADVAAVDASGVGAVAVSSPTIFQYPQQPARDDGRMLAIASLIGGLIDAVLGGDGVSDAADAEAKWKDLLDNVMKARGTSEINRVDSERAKLPDFEADLKAQLTEYRQRADALWPLLAPLHDNMVAQVTDRQNHADAEWALVGPNNTIIDGEIVKSGSRADILWNELPALDTVIHESITKNGQQDDAEVTKSEALCTDDAFAKLCEFVACGYQPDYAGIADRARADAELAAASAYEQACRTGNRYNMRRSASAQLDVRLATISASLGATAEAREKERQFAFTTNHNLRLEHAKVLEQTRLGRRELALKYADREVAQATERYVNHQKASMELDLRRQAMATERWNAHTTLAGKLDHEAVEILRERWNAIAKLYLDLEGSADRLSEMQWKMFMDSAFKSLREGGEMLSAAAQGYQFLAASIRATAKQGGGGTGGVAGALATLATVFPLFNGQCGVSQPLGGLIGDWYARPQQCCTTT